MITARLSRIATLCVALLAWAPGSEAPFISDKDWEAQKNSAPAGTESAPVSPGRALATMTVAVVIIIGLGIGAVVLIRRLGTRRGSAGSARHLSVVETLPVGVKRSLLVVRLGDQVVLVGSHEQGLTALAQMPATVLAAEGASPAAASASAPAPAPVAVPGTGTGAAFAAVLENLVGKSK